jgi:GH43 family beta-xylosidase
MSETQKYILCYTRKPQDDMIYASRLAYSMHLAYSDDGRKFEALNHNSGVLFAKAADNPDGTMNAKSLKSPFLFPMAGGGFGAVAVRTAADGKDDPESRGKILFFATEDLLQYTEIGLIDLHTAASVEDVRCGFDTDQKIYWIKWKDQGGQWFKNKISDLHCLGSASMPVCTEAVCLNKIDADIEGIVPRNVICVPEKIGNRLKFKLSVPYNVSIEAPKEINASSAGELKQAAATAVYNDGTAARKTVDWDDSAVNWSQAGVYKISGTVHQDSYRFPIAFNRADPCIRQWNGKYYFIATNDADNNHTLYIRESDSIPGLVSAEETLLLDSDTYDDVKGLLWAPEFHVIKGELYIFLAVTAGEFFCEESNVMKLEKGGNPARREDWSKPERVRKSDGSYLCEAGKTISLDMTVIEGTDEYYAVWSERQFLPVDAGAWLYIARINPDEPWKLVSDPVLLTKPEYGWENNHTFVDEGPFALKTDQKLFLTFSGALVDAAYTVGLLTAEPGADLLNPKSWTKTNYPLLTSRSVRGEYGPGHNAFVRDENGDVWVTYHARPGIKGCRSSGIRRVHFDIDGYPVLDLTEDRDLDKKLKQITAKLIVR